MEAASIKSAVRQYAPHGDWYALAGSGNAKRRQDAMLAMTGNKLPQSKCGIAALRNTSFAAAGIQPACLARMEDALAAWAKVSA